MNRLRRLRALMVKEVLIANKLSIGYSGALGVFWTVIGAVSQRSAGTTLLGLGTMVYVPLLTLVMAANFTLGVSAGEEIKRRTAETLLSSPVSIRDMWLAKVFSSWLLGLPAFLAVAGVSMVVTSSILEVPRPSAVLLVLGLLTGNMITLGILSVLGFLYLWLENTTVVAIATPLVLVVGFNLVSLGKLGRTVNLATVCEQAGGSLALLAVGWYLAGLISKEHITTRLGRY